MAGGPKHLCHFWPGGHGSGPACGADPRGNYHASQHVAIVTCEACKGSEVFKAALAAPPPPRTFTREEDREFLEGMVSDMAANGKMREQANQRLIGSLVRERDEARKHLDEAIGMGEQALEGWRATQADRDALRTIVAMAAEKLDRALHPEGDEDGAQMLIDTAREVRNALRGSL